MTRNDIHRPSEVDPTAYTYVTSIDLDETFRGPDARQRREARTQLEHRLRAGSPHDRCGQCAHCGAGLRYVAVMQYGPDHQLLPWGHDCLETLGMLDSKAAAKLRQLKLARQRRVTAELNQAAVEEFQQAEPELFAWMQQVRDEGHDFEFVRSVVGQFFSDPVRGLTEGQMRGLRKCFEGWKKYQAKKAEREQEAERTDRQEVPNGNQRIKVRGRVLTIDERENDYGWRLVMTVEDDKGFRVWGTAPNAIADVLGQHFDKDGDPIYVEFMARVNQSEDDRYFGFFSRPTKARVLEHEDRPNVCPSCGHEARDVTEIYHDGTAQVCTTCVPAPF